MTRKAITSATVALTRRYLLHPDEFWDAADGRQARKLRRLRSVLRDATAAGERPADVVEEVLAIARLRTSHAPPPIYLANIGSSGSHWLAAMLARAAGVHDCGEVYLPKSMPDQLRGGTTADAEFFVHAVHALHTGHPGPAMVAGAFVNSAHHTRVSTVASLTPGARTVLLVRHPVDVVLSRTLRKPEYRNSIAPGMDDRAYLEQNCVLVERFFRESRAEHFDAQVRYEDLVDQPAQTLADLMRSLGLEPRADDAIEQAVAATSPQAVKAAAERGERAPTNLFVGEARQADPGLVRAARKRLRAACELLGYADRGEQA
jgi:hypothetical protein